MKKSYVNKILSFLLMVVATGSLKAQVITQTISNTYSIQSYTVPLHCGNVTIQAVGASGGAVSNCSPIVPGGMGANMKGEFNINAGTVLRILAGQIGQSSGGDGGGGGGSFVALAQGTVPVIVAGGGGGSSSQVNNCTASLVLGVDASTTTSGNASRNGQAAGGLNGQGGAISGTNVSSGGAGGGFYGDGAYFVNTTAGGKAFVNGGAGGTPNTVSTAGGFGGGGCSWSVGGGGGGGGGYSGGGSWQQNPYCGGGGGGSYNSGSNQVNAINTSSGNGYVLITFDAGSPITTSASQNTICEGETVNLSASGTGLISYTWSAGPTQANITVTPAVTSSFVVSATNGANCVSYDTVFIHVNPLPVIVSSTTPGLLCVGNSATMTVSGAPSFTWSGGPESNEYVVWPEVTTVYTVSGTSPEGCVTDKTVAVNVSTNTMGISPNSTICAGKQVTLTATGANSYLWNTSPQSPFNPQVLNPTVTTIYIVNGVDAFGCLISNTVIVTVNPKPTILLTSSDNQACTGDKVVLTASGGDTYAFGPQVTGSGNTGTVIPTVNITQIYTVTGTSTAGCTNTAQVVVQVSKCDGIGEQNANSAKVFPNPGNGLFIVELSEVSANSKLMAYDVSGKLVHSADASAQTTIDLRNQPQGIYILYISDSNGRRQVARLIRE